MSRQLPGAFFTIIGCLSAAICWAADIPDKYFFHLAGRDFTREEALKIAGGKSDLQAAVQENFPAAAAIVLCSRVNIELSPARTREFLANSLRLMPLVSQASFKNMLIRENLDQKAWLDREKNKLTNQLSEAVIRWYIKVYGEESPITDEHVQNWYYRNMDIFRRVKLDPAKVWAFKVADSDKMRKALAALQQAVPPETVRKNFAEPLTSDVMNNELHLQNIRRTAIGEGYWLITGEKYMFLTVDDAVSYTALPLDEPLKEAIRNALHEALAKARLAETLKKDFNGKKIIFY